MKNFTTSMEFRKTFEKVGKYSINLELDEYNKMTPSCQIKALYHLHKMELLSATLGVID